MKTRLVEESLNEFLGFGDKKRIKEYISNILHNIDKAKVPEQDLNSKMAYAAIKSLNSLNFTLDKILGDKSIAKLAQNTNSTAGPNVFSQIQKIKNNIKADPHGRNRAKNDQSADVLNVYLGDVQGYHTKTISDYLEAFRRQPDKDGERILGEQLYKWINTNVDALKWQLETLIGIRK